MNEQSAKDPDDLRQDIEETREDLGDTVDALSAKADVAGRAKGAANEQLVQLVARARERPLMYLGAAAGVGLALGWIIRGR